MLKSGATPSTTAILLFTVIVLAISFANKSYFLSFNPFICDQSVSNVPPSIRLTKTKCAKKEITKMIIKSHSGKGNGKGRSLGTGVGMFVCKLINKLFIIFIIVCFILFVNYCLNRIVWIDHYTFGLNSFYRLS